MGCFADIFRTKKSSLGVKIPQLGGCEFDEIRKSKHFDVDGDGDGSCLVKKRYNWVDIETLSRNFSRIVGSGGFSTVYLADSIQGAIKIHFGSERLHQVFKQELDILLRLNHRNIVKLIGYCDNQDDQGALVLEYVPNGSLHERLHECTSASDVLSWRTRMTIAFQLVEAIEYLHEKCSLQIVHGDIKSSNVLLDESLNCKLCDFGSAKMGFSSIVSPSDSVSCPSRRTNKLMMVGSPGYTDPHYLRTGIASKKNDVYSYGVIVLELITGLEAFCPERQSGQLLTSVLGPVLRGESVDVTEIVDPKLGGEFDIEEARLMVSIAALCLGNSPILRPSATQILQTMNDSVYSISFPERK